MRLLVSALLMLSPVVHAQDLPTPKMDLRTMLRHHVLRRSSELLAKAAARRAEAIRSGKITAFAARARTDLLEVLGDVPFGKAGGPLNVRLVSRQDRGDYRLENVLFESVPGWDVNASVYLPRPEAHPPPWPAIVVPVGHSGKQFESYQIPAQVFARSGYVAVTFDPPGQAGEKRPGNDHFRDGVRCYLTGSTSQRYFVLDALRAVDYLATRADVDMRHGVGMTGVSGGGFTTLYAAPLDDRIAVAGPSCFAAPELRHPLEDAYPPCPETLASGIYPRGLDAVTLLLAAHPKPLLVMAGRDDEVFKAEWMQGMADEAARAYVAAGGPDRFRFFLDAGGHAYTIAHALEFVRWMDRWVRGTPGRTVPNIARADLEMAPYELLRSFPRPEENMLTLVRQEARRLAGTQRDVAVRKAATQLAGLEPDWQRSWKPPTVESSKPFLIWSHYLEELLLGVDTDVQLPATLLYDAKASGGTGAILYFDDRGRWVELAANGMLATMAGFTRDDGPKPAVLSVDLRGWGDTRPAFSPYDAAGWASPQRSLAYVSAALGDPVLAMRIRDGLAALTYLRSRPQVDPKRIVIGGYGMGGVVALHVAALDSSVAGVFTAGMPASFRTLAESPAYNWDHDAFFPGVLRHYDLPELAASLRAPVLLVNLLDALKQPVAEADAKVLYGPAPRLEVAAGLSDSNARKVQGQWVSMRWNGALQQ